MTSACSYADWRNDFSKVIRSVCRLGLPILVGIDANYQVHEQAWCGVGPLAIRRGPHPDSHDLFASCVENFSFQVVNAIPDLFFQL